MKGIFENNDDKSIYHIDRNEALFWKSCFKYKVVILLPLGYFFGKKRKGRVKSPLSAIKPVHSDSSEQIVALLLPNAGNRPCPENHPPERGSCFFL